MKTAPLVSVIVPCWNGSSYLAQALDSVRGQSMADWECIIVYGGSTDGTPEVAARLTEAGRRIRVARQRQRGIGAVGTVVPAPVRRRLGPVPRSRLEG